MRIDLLLSEQLYAALMRLYPVSFRAAYGAQMRQTFRDACQAACRQNGTAGLVTLWLPTLLDLFKSALEERAQQGEISMSKTRLMAWAGPLTGVVGLLWLLTALGDLLLRTLLAGSDAFLGLVILPFFLSFIPMLFAQVGIRLRYHPSAGSLGRAGLALSVTGCAGLMIALLANILLSSAVPEVGPPLWVNYTALICSLSIRAGFILFGIDALRFRLLPRWNLLPLLLGLTVLLSLPMEWFGVPALLPTQGWTTPFLHFAISGLCWLLMGMALQGHPELGQGPASTLPVRD